MDVRVCPKCGAENKRANATCSSCYASLARVPLTQSRTPSQPVAAQPSAGPTPTVQGRMPLSGPPPRAAAAARPNPPGGPGAPGPYSQPGPRGPAPGHQPPPEPVRSGPSPWIFALILLVLVGSGVGIALWYQAGSAEPEIPADKVVVAFLEAKRTADPDKVEPYLSRESVDLVRKSFSSRQARSAGIDEKQVADMFLFGIDPTPEDLKNLDIQAEVVPEDDTRNADKNTRLVRATLVEKPGEAQSQNVQAGDGDEFEFSMAGAAFEYVVVREDAEWKVDLGKTRKRAMEGIGPALKLLFPDKE